MIRDDVKKRLDDYNSVSKSERFKDLLKWVLVMTVALFAFVLFMFFVKQRKAHAEAVHGDRPVRGYFWYECSEGYTKNSSGECVKAEEPKREQTVSKRQEQTAKAEKEEFEFPVKDEAPPIMKQFLKDPTEENAKEYLAWQYRYMKHLGKIGFALRDAYVKHGGELYPIKGYPENPLGSIYYKNAQNDLYKAVLSPLKGKVGFIYFYSVDHPGHRHQSEIVAMLKDKYGFSIRGVAVEGDVDYSLPFFSTRNPDLAAKFGVTPTQLPTVFAVLDKDGEPRVAGIGAGFTALDVMESQLIKFLVQEGLIRERDLSHMMSYGR